MLSGYHKLFLGDWRLDTCIYNDIIDCRYPILSVLESVVDKS